MSRTILEQRVITDFFDNRSELIEHLAYIVQRSSEDAQLNIAIGPARSGGWCLSVVKCKV